MNKAFVFRKSWRNWLALLSACIGCGLWLIPGRLHGAAPKPLNILFILADDLGWSDVGCYGGDLHETPNIDRLARQGVRFTDAYAAAPVCSPTRASLMTGKHPARLHLTTWYEAAANPPRNRKLIPPVTVANLPHTETTVAKTLQSAGYLTALVGKWHLGEAAFYPETHGFDINIGGTHWGAPQTYFYPYRGSQHFGGEFRYVPHLEFGRSGEYLTDRLTDEALKIIDSAQGRPFFLYLAHHAPHAPIEAKSDLVAHFAKKISPQMHHENASYAAMIQSLDESVGRLLARLASRNLADRTVVIFTSDNGGYLKDSSGRFVTDNYPLRSGKGALYEGGLRVPLIIRWPGVTLADAICHEPVVSTDLFKTLLEITGMKTTDAPDDGVSLMPLLRSPAAHSSRAALYFHYPHYYPTTTPVSAVRAGEFKLLEFLEDNHVELYNLKTDLSEQNNLAASLPAQAEELRQQLHAWRKQVAAQMPQPNPNFDASKLDSK
ncbi:MAG: sulfatase [Verrucomicrobia bacterium]|nr:sulfatase [Verrucomicrobiota bacterium]